MQKPVGLTELIDILKSKGVKNLCVLEAIRSTPRHLFVEDAFKLHAYLDVALPTTQGQTISQPYIVARMTELLIDDAQPQKILEVGTGSGYQAAVLAHIVPQIYTIERIKTLYDAANQRFKQLDLTNIHTRLADGSDGWPQAAPFDGIIVTAATSEVPAALLTQLAEGGRMVIPIGDSNGQVLSLIERHGGQFKTQLFDPVIFVPLLYGIEK